jgi:hypothetical protein
MFTDVRDKLPAERLLSARYLCSQRLFLFQEKYVSPGGGSQSASIIVGEAGPFETVIGELIPLFASDFAGLAADA